MNDAIEYLYRGTTLGWKGTYSNRTLPMTCTSTDPLIATYFALECFFFGHSVVQIIKRASVEHLIGGRNHFDSLELAVNLTIKPGDLWDYSELVIDATSAREILFDLGFDQVPYFIYKRSGLDDELAIARDLGYRLTKGQIARFNQLATEIER